jgi:hypothetical protein
VIGSGRIRRWVQVIRSRGISNWVRVIRSRRIRSDWAGVECNGGQWVGGDNRRRRDALNSGEEDIVRVNRGVVSVALALSSRDLAGVDSGAEGADLTAHGADSVDRRVVGIEKGAEGRMGQHVVHGEGSRGGGAVASSGDVVGQLFEVSSGVRMLVLGVGDVALDVCGHRAHIGIEVFNAFVQVVSQLYVIRRAKLHTCSSSFALARWYSLESRGTARGGGWGGSTGWFFALGCRG